MLRFLQALNGTFIVKFMLVLIGLSFIGWEFGSGFSRAAGGTVLTVNDQEMGVRAFQRDLEGRLNQMRNRLGDAYTPELLARFNVVEAMLENKISELLLLDFAREQNLSVAPEALASAISQIPAFQDGLGSFSSSQYKIALQNAGYSIPQFEQAMAADMLINQVRAPFEGIRFTNNEEAERLAEVMTESRDVRVLRVVNDDVAAPPAPSQSDLRTIYEDMQSSLQTPEFRTFNILTFSAERMRDQVSVGEEDIKDYYQEYKHLFGEPEGRKVRHILLPDMEAAQKAVHELEKGRSFSQVAKELSRDETTAGEGGDLGVIYRGDMLPAFDETAFNLEVGDISEPVKTPFGVHIIKVESVESGGDKTLADVKDEIRETLEKEKTLNILFDRAEEADDMLAAGAGLKEAAETVGGQLETITLQSNGMGADGKTLAPELLSMANPEKILDQVFTMDEGIPSTPIVLDDKTKAFIEVTEVTPSRQQSFDEVQDELHAAYEKEMYERAVLAKATKALTARMQGKSFEALAKELDLTAPIQKFVGITRAEKAKTPLINDAVQQQLVALQKGEVLEQVIPTKMGAAIYEVIDVEAGSPEDGKMTEMQALLSQNLSSDLFQQFITALQNDAKIEINQDQLVAIKERVLPDMN